MLQFAVPAACAIILYVLHILWTRYRSPATIDDVNTSRYKALSSIREKNEVAASLSKLVELDGAGAWPPNVEHDAWPAALRPYKEIYQEMAPLLSQANPSIDDEANNSIRTEFRAKMEKALEERINISQVTEIMKATAAGDWSVLPRDAYNGLYCCIAVSRHMFRYLFSRRFF